MIIKRKEGWGDVRYDLVNHDFSYNYINDFVRPNPYLSQPVLLNIDLTFRCNMKCIHCVAKDMEEMLVNRYGNSDLVISDRLINDINESPFIAIVITGGEPLLPEYENQIVKLLEKIKNKAIIIDTNGTISPSIKLINLLKSKKAMLRVSWDIPVPSDECQLRKYPDDLYKNPQHYMESKEKLIKYFLKNQITTGIQTVIHGQNFRNRNMYSFPKKLKSMGINKWYLQRFIPSYRAKTDTKFIIPIKEYEEAVKKIKKAAQESDVTCTTKKDRRHNSVFLLVRDGDIYTQSDEIAGQKIFIGRINNIKDWFRYVSSSDHSVRYCL